MAGKFSPKKLMLARHENGFTQEELARRMTVSRNTVVLWESGRFVPGRENVDRLAGVLNKSASHFFEEERHETQEPRAVYGGEAGARSAAAVPSDNTLTLPLLAGMPGTLPGFSEKDIESFVYLPRYIFPAADFMIRCSTDAAEIGAAAGDYCVIRKTAEAAPGKAVLARTGQGFSIRRMPGEGGRKNRPGEVVGQVIGLWKKIE